MSQCQSTPLNKFFDFAILYRTTEHRFSLVNYLFCAKVILEFRFGIQSIDSIRSFESSTSGLFLIQNFSSPFSIQNFRVPYFLLRNCSHTCAHRGIISHPVPFIGHQTASSSILGINKKFKIKVLFFFCFISICSVTFRYLHLVSVLHD